MSTGVLPHTLGPAEMSELSKINIRSWYYTQENGLLDLIQGAAAGVVSDGRNKPGQQEIQDGCYGIVIANHEVNGVVHKIGQVIRLTGKSTKQLTNVWQHWTWAKDHAVVYDMVPITQPLPVDELELKMTMAGIALADRAAVFDYLMGKF